MRERTAKGSQENMAFGPKGSYFSGGDLEPYDDQLSQTFSVTMKSEGGMPGLRRIPQ
jgi:hypothetical protein